MLNAYRIRGSVVMIEVPYRFCKKNLSVNFITTIDRRDLPRVQKLRRWTARVSVNGFYVVANHNGQAIPLHQLVLGDSALIPGLEPDHIDRNPLNNRRRNLRLVTRADNCLNRRRGRPFVSLADRIAPFMSSARKEA